MAAAPDEVADGDEEESRPASDQETADDDAGDEVRDAGTVLRRG
jgi:hypothetical protein